MEVYFGFVAYLLLIIGIGVFAAKSKTTSLNDYFLAGRGLNKFVVALSAVASGRSGWLLIGFVGISYTIGFAAIWACVGYLIAEFLMFIFLAPKLRKFSEENDCITIPGYFALFFGEKNTLLRGLFSLIIIIFMLTYVSAQFVSGGKVFENSFDIERETGMILTAVIILGYTLLGGFKAVSKTDIIQAVFMFLALVILPIVAIVQFGGWLIVSEALHNNSSNFTDYFSLSLWGVVGFLGIGLGSPGAPHILVRYMAIKNTKDLYFSGFLGTFWNIIMAFGAWLTGLVGRAYFPNPEVLGGDAEHLFTQLGQEIIHPIVFGLLIAAIFSAIMSSADSQLLVAASSVVSDLYEKVFKKEEVFDEKKLVKLSRVVVAILVVLALLVGFHAEQMVFWLVLFAVAGMGASIGASIVLTMIWKGTTAMGVITGSIAGIIVVFLWSQGGYLHTNVWTIYSLVPAFITSVSINIVVSLFTRKNKPDNYRW